MQEMMKNYLKDTDFRVQDGSNVKNRMCDMMSVLMEVPLMANSMTPLAIINMTIKTRILVTVVMVIQIKQCIRIMSRLGLLFKYNWIIWFLNSSV